MSSFEVFFQEMMMLYLLALLGFFARKMEILNKYATSVMTNLILYITLPALILFSLNLSFQKAMLHDFLWLLLMSGYILCLSIVLVRAISQRSSLPSQQKSVFEGITIFGNQGFIGYAVSYLLLGEDGLLYVTLFNIIYLFLIWTYGIHLFTKSTEAIAWKEIFLNPGVLSTFIGLIVLFSPFTWPLMIANTLESVGKMTIPLSMMLIGILIAGMEVNPIKAAIKNKYLWISACLKLIMIPLLLLVFLAFHIPISLLIIAIVVSGMPSAPTISIYAEKYGGGDSLFSSFGVLLTSVLCILTIPLLYGIVLFFHNP